MVDLYEYCDVQKIKEDDWYVKRFLLARRRNVDDAFEMLKATMKWRKELELPTIKDWRFPTEFYKIGGLFPYEKDLQGNAVVYMRICFHRKIPELEEATRRFVMHVFNKVDKHTNGNGFALVFDLTNAGYSNVDWDFLKFLINSGQSYFPVGLKYILVYNIPWMLNAFRKLAFSILSEEMLGMLKFANDVEILKYISKENLPDYMGGTCKRNYRAVPKGARSVQEVAIEYGYTKEDISRIMPNYKKLLEEADNALSKGNFQDPVDYFDDPPQELNGAKPNTDLLELIFGETINFDYDASTDSFNGDVILKNRRDVPVAFKIQSNFPKNYCVSPRLGILLPKSVLRIAVQLLVNPNDVSISEDKFLILAAEVSEMKMNAGEFSKIWQERKSSIAYYKIRTCLCLDSNKSDNCSQYSDEGSFSQQIKRLNDRFQQTSERITLLFNLVFVFAVLLVCSLAFNSYLLLRQDDYLPNFFQNLIQFGSKVSKVRDNF